MVGVQVLSYDLVKSMRPSQKIKKILEIVMKGDVVMIEGKLASEEETSLISSALEVVSKKFSGIEIAYLDSKSSNSFVDKFKDRIVKVLAGDRVGITVVGPSKLVKEIKMDPQKLEILFK